MEGYGYEIEWDYLGSKCKYKIKKNKGIEFFNILILKNWKEEKELVVDFEKE